MATQHDTSKFPSEVLTSHTVIPLDEITYKSDNYSPDEFTDEIKMRIVDAILDRCKNSTAIFENLCEKIGVDKVEFLEENMKLSVHNLLNYLYRRSLQKEFINTLQNIGIVQSSSQ